MGRKCKCRICGEVLDVSIAYKTIVNGKNFYCCSESEYEESESKKRKAIVDKDRVYRLICNVIDRKEIINTVLWKEWKTWNVVANDETIAEYLEDNKNYLIDVINRLDDVEFNRIRYLSAILKNKLGDFKSNKKEVQRQIVNSVAQEEHYETKFKLKQRVGFDDMEDDYDE